jgi:uncharacterized protein YndB with AHSA1/START domain
MSELHLERTFAAPPTAVFDAWTNPEVLRRWWAAAPDWGTALAEVDLRPGGRYRLSMHDPGSGTTHTVGGEYVEVERPARLVYTWTWEGDPEEMRGSADSVVTVRFDAEGSGTRVVLDHAGLADDEIAAKHEHGWNACMDNLAARVLTGAPART